MGHAPQATRENLKQHIRDSAKVKNLAVAYALPGPSKLATAGAVKYNAVEGRNPRANVNYAQLLKTEKPAKKDSNEK